VGDYPGEPIAANSLVFITADGTAVLADTPWTPEATRELLDWVVARTGRLPAFATIGHYHLDASGGIAALREAGVPVVASSEAARLLAERAPSMQEELARQHGDAFGGWRIPPPDRTFHPASGYVTRVGGTGVEVIFPGAAHSPDNVVTWFPEARLLFGGCMIKGGDSLGYLGDADLASYAGAVERLITLAPRIVVPGHGDRTDPGQLEHTRDLARAARPSP
jgi:metallo-beta-lactamase class B